jgi:hypothetical protein
MILTGGNRSTRTETCPSATFSTSLHRLALFPFGGYLGGWGEIRKLMKCYRNIYVMQTNEHSFMLFNTIFIIKCCPTCF